MSNQTSTTNKIGNASAIISAATALIMIVASFKRSEWNRGNNKKKTGARMAILKDATYATVGQYALDHHHQGINHIKNMVENRSKLNEDVFQTMAKSGVLDNYGISAIFAKNWAKQSVSTFFKSSNFGWTRVEMNKLADECFASLKSHMIAQGYENDTTNAKPSTNWLLWGVVGIIAIILIKKILF